MARKAIDIKIRMERQEKKIIQLKKELENAQDEYEKMKTEMKAEQKKKLLEALEHSGRSYEEIIDFLKGKADI